MEDQNKDQTQQEPEINKWWEKSKPFSRKKYSNVASLYTAICEYFEWCAKNPLIEIDFVGKDATQVERPRMRVFTMWGLEHHLNVSSTFFETLERECRLKNDDESLVWLSCIDWARNVVRTQKFEGAAVGAFNANLISRDLGLADKLEANLTSTKIVVRITGGTGNKDIELGKDKGIVSGS